MKMGNNLTNKAIDNKLDKVQDLVTKLIETSEKTVNGELDDILKFNEDYLYITKQLNNISNDLFAYDKTRTNALWDKFDSINDDLNYIYDTTSTPINSVIVKKTLELQDENKKHQGVQLAIFSMVLSILAFVLTNAKILAVEQINFKNVLLVNLSFILSIDILFSFIYLFLGPIFYSKKGKLRLFTFIILPILLIASIVCISLFM